MDHQDFVPRRRKLDVLNIVLENIGTDDLTLPIGVDSLNLLAAGAGRSYFTLVKGSDPNAPDLASAKLAMNAEHPESAAKLKPGDTMLHRVIAWPEATGRRFRTPYRAVISLHQITTSEGAVRDEMMGSEVRSEISRVWR